MKSILKWLLIYAWSVVAVAFATLALPTILDRLSQNGLAEELMSQQAMAEKFMEDRAAITAGMARMREEITAAPADEIQRRLGPARAMRENLDQQLQVRPTLLASLSPREVMARKKLELERVALEGEIALLESATRRHSFAAELRNFEGLAARPLDKLEQACRANERALLEFKSRFLIEQAARNLVFHDEEGLKTAKENSCSSYQHSVEARNGALRKVREAQAALAAADSAYASAGEQAVAKVASVALGFQWTFRRILLYAAFMLVGIFATPYLIRLLFYFVFAPIAQRRKAIRLRSHLGLTHPELSQPSGTSAPITLMAGEELLVRQGFLQSTSTQGSKRTLALLEWRDPLNSLASGLSFLTWIVGEGETTVISAVHDPLAEVAVLRLDEGGACVLHPRALVAVVKPSDRSLRITSHWRLFSLHAWLTLQLRYLAFHGPCRLVLKGGRGLRLEGAESGRIFGPDQLVGFSPDLAYTVTRTETFWPYFLGRESLFKDRVDAGGGVVVIEEAPMGGGGRGPRKGLEGAFDVALKAFGL